jgi:hypothetical protein
MLSLLTNLRYCHYEASERGKIKGKREEKARRSPSAALASSATFASRNHARFARSQRERKLIVILSTPVEGAPAAQKRFGKTILTVAASLAISAVSAAVKARAVDVVPVVDLNFRFADCQPQQRTYDLKKCSTIYYGASIVCQLNVAYITYDQKYRYPSG